MVVAPTLGRSQRHFFDRMAKFFVSLATAVKGATKNDGPTDTKSSEAQLGTRTVGRPSRELMLCPVGQQVARALARFATHEGKPSSTGRTVVTGRRRDQRSGRRAPRFFQPGATDPKRGFLRLSENVIHPKTEVITNVMETECSGLLNEFFQKLRE